MPDMRFTLNRAAHAEVLKHEGLTEADVPYKWGEIWFAHTPEEKNFMTHLEGAMYHPGRICSCPPEPDDA
jgi:hypothetical protein